MDLKIQVNTITIKDENVGEEYTIKTVRTVKEIYEDLTELEKEALENKVHRLAELY